MNRPFRIGRRDSPEARDPAERWHAPDLLADLLAEGRPGSPPTPAPRRAFWVLSDLRVDLAPDLALPDPPADYDAVLVAGNVGPGLCDALLWLAVALGGRHGDRPVLVVPGHVEYRSPLPMAAALARGRDLAERLGFHLLSDDAVRFGPPGGGGTVVIGATLWTDWRLRHSTERPSARVVARTAWEDAHGTSLRLGRPLTPLDTLAMHARSRAFIEDALTSVVIASLRLGRGRNACVDCALPGDVAVVLTCHAPTPRSLPADWEGWHADGWVAASLASEASAAMDAWGAPPLWVHGNVPGAVDQVVGRTRVVANPRVGWGGRADIGFDPGLVVALRGDRHHAIEPVDRAAASNAKEGA